MTEDVRLLPDDELPEDNTQLGYVNKCVNKHVKEYKHKRNKSRDGVFRTRMISALLAALTTVVLGVGASKVVGPTFTDYASIVALFLSALVAVMSAWQVARGDEWKWITFRTTLSDLYILKDDIAFAIAGGKPIPGPEVKAFYERVKQILQEANAEWNLRRREQPQRKDDPKSGKTEISPSDV